MLFGLFVCFVVSASVRVVVWFVVGVCLLVAP